jgi:AraC-like DNA-binding protein
MLTRLDTHDFAPGRRLAAWQDIVCDVYVQLDCASDRRSDFRGAITRTSLGSIACTTVSSIRQTVDRTPARIRRSAEEFVLISVGRSGVGQVIQDGREAVIGPGHFALYDTTRPYRLRFDGDFDQIVYQIPREAAVRKLGSVERLTAVAFAGDAAVERLAFNFLADVARSADGLSPFAAERTAEQMLDLVAVAAAERCVGPADASTSHRAVLLLRLKSFIESRLGDGDLTLAKASAAFGLSPRYVNDLLAEDGTSFQRHVLARRLEHCRRQLAAREFAGRSVSEIAWSWGFSDLSHFSRAFKERFGLSPRAWRNASTGDAGGA